MRSATFLGRRPSNIPLHGMQGGAYLGAFGPAAGAAEQRSGHKENQLRNTLVAAARGFLRAISLGRRKQSASVQQDMLNLLTIWFRFSNTQQQEVNALLVEEVASASLDAWLGVLPQLIARIHIDDSMTRATLHRLLAALGRRHPQALVWPLAVQIKSPRVDRREAAGALMASLRQHSGRLVEQATLVSSEMIRVAILWHELWHEALEEASRLYFSVRDIPGMLAALLPLHEQLETGPTTLREQEFEKAFGRELKMAYDCIKRYQTCSTLSNAAAEAEASLNQAWDLYYTVFRRINKQLPSLAALDLELVSPSLLCARDLELAVPGTYVASTRLLLLLLLLLLRSRAAAATAAPTMPAPPFTTITSTFTTN